jgi:hypothetical protein
VPSGIAFNVQAAEQTAHPTSGPAQAAGALPQIAVRKIGEQPTVLAGLVIQLSVVSLVDNHILFGA